MSSLNLSNNNIIKRIPCCKVCKDAGEPENVYTSHYVKNREGIVTCPKLKAIVCLNCGKRGHTISYCKYPSKKNRENNTEKSKQQIVSVVATKQCHKNKFDYLFEEDDVSDNETPVVNENKHSDDASLCKSTIANTNTNDFPSLLKINYKPINTAINKTEAKSLSYANIVSKPAETKIVKQIVAVPTISEKPVRIYQKASEIDWAMEGSDSDEDF